MRYTSAFLLIAVAAAQSISDIPSCAVSCLANGVQRVNCGLTDFRCSCQKSTQLTQILTPCVQQSCPSVTDQQKVVTVLAGICQQAGVPVTVPTVTGGASSVPVYTSAPLAGSSQSRGGGGGASTGKTFFYHIPAREMLTPFFSVDLREHFTKRYFDCLQSNQHGKRS